ncbi:hypothetical protein MRGA423_18945 [Mycobacterium tuberculosis RGTB423]|nr:hypothetical protein MRGA423_18945 [Mycobacterium tuberculosis RGTB423]
MIATRVFAPVFQWRSGEYSVMPRAQQRRRHIQGQHVGYAQHVVFVDDDRFAVAALGWLAVFADRVVGEVCARLAVLFDAARATVALAARVHETANPNAVALPVLGHLRAHGGHHAGDLVARDHRVIRLAPLGFDGMDVRVTDSGELDVESPRRAGPGRDG